MRWVARHRWGLIVWLAWVLTIVSTFVVPVTALFPYAIAWAGAVVAVSGFFAGGYLLLSKPSRDEDGHRRWQSLWFWLLVLVGLFFLVFLRTFVFGLLIPAPVAPTPQQVESYRSSVAIFSACFYIILWLTVVWVRLQVQKRRVLRSVDD